MSFITEWINELDPNRVFFHNDIQYEENINNHLDFFGARSYMFMTEIPPNIDLDSVIHTYLIWLYNGSLVRNRNKSQAFDLPFPFDLQNLIKDYV